MHFDSWSAFWDMGGYGFFVWLSFSVTLGAMLLLVIESRMARKKLKRSVLAEVARKNRIEKHQREQAKEQDL